MKLQLPANYLNLIEWFINFYPYDYGTIGSQFIPPNLSINSRKPEPNIIKSSPKKLPKPNEQQQRAIENINNNQKNLLFGITGIRKN
jgi:primosomal protein N'